MDNLEKIMQEIDIKNVKYYRNHKDKIDNLLLKNNSKMLKVFRGLPDCKVFRNSGSYMVGIKLKNNEESYMIISHYFAYIYQNGKLRNLYKYNTHSSFVATAELNNVIRQCGLSPTWAIFTKNFSQVNDLTMFNTNKIVDDMKRRCVAN